MQLYQLGLDARGLPLFRTLGMTATVPDSWKAVREQLGRIVKSGPFVQSRRLLRPRGIEVLPQRSCCERELQDDRFWHLADICSPISMSE
jgi:hypothetical protein